MTAMETGKIVEETQMRDTRKPESYFTAYISYEQSRIQKRNEKLLQCSEPAKEQRICENLFYNQMNLLVASFSKGAEKAELTELFENCCLTAQKIPTLTYENALKLVSFAIMLSCTDKFCAVAERFSKVFEKDRLLKGFCSFAVSGKAMWDGDYRFPEIYGSMEDVLQAKEKAEKENAVQNYLNGWYERNKESAWYETLNSANDVYYGYWSFESAAVAVIYGLNQEYLAQNVYFPKL